MKPKLEIKESIRKEIKEIVIARLETLNKDAKIMLMGYKKPISVRELLEEVRNDTEFGKKIVEVQFAFLKMLTKGEI